MTKKNLLIGIAAGAAILSVALLFKRNGKYNWSSLSSSAEDALDNLKQRISGKFEEKANEFTEHSAGKQLVERARRKAEQHLTMSKNGHH